MTISESFKSFQYLTSNFLENENLFQKIQIENLSFLFKTALSEANVKTNRTATTKWTYPKEWSFASNYVIFFGKLVLVLEPL